MRSILRTWLTILGLLSAAALAACAPVLSPSLTPAMREKVEDRLAGMSLEAKVGQVFMGWFRGAEAGPFVEELVVRRQVGGLALFDAAGNVAGPAQVARLTAALQAMARRAGGPGLLLAVDQEGGPVARLRQGFAVMPSNMAVGATGDPAMAKLAARNTAAQLRAVGLNVNLAPVLDVNSNPANPVIGTRSFGADPEAVAAMGLAAMEAYVQAGVIPVAKHFPGHGDTASDSHLGLPRAAHDMERLERVELVPFARAVGAGAPMIMTAHLEVLALDPQPVPATLSRAVLQGLLRRRMGFDGVIVTDSMGMGAVTRTYGVGRAAVMALEAGADLLLYGADKGHDPDDVLAAMTAVKGAVQLGRLSRDRLDQAVRRVLRLKARFGLWRPEPEKTPARAADMAGFREAEAAARNAALTVARASVTLVRDRGGVLPLPLGERALLVWPQAANDPVEAIAGTEGLEVLRTPADPGPDDVTRAVTMASRSGTAVVFLSRADLRLGQAALVRALAAAPKVSRLAVCAMDAPYDLGGLAEAPCLLAAYCNAPASVRAVLDVLYGRAPAPGRLPVDVPGLD